MLQNQYCIIVLCGTISPYVIMAGAFNKKMKLIFNARWGNGNTLFVLLGLKGKSMINVIILIFKLPIW